MREWRYVFKFLLFSDSKLLRYIKMNCNGMRREGVFGVKCWTDYNAFCITKLMKECFQYFLHT